jgi:nucleoside-diphosphate-sugar epimerase
MTRKWMTGKRKLSIAAMIRIVADLLILHVSVAAAFLLYFALSRDASREILSVVLVKPYFCSAWFLSLVGPIVFYLMGFYTKGRAYQSRYKLLVIVQASTLLFILLGFAAYATPYLRGFPRSILFLAWLLSTSLLVVARLWAHIWNGVVEREHHVRLRSKSAPIENVLLIGGAGYIGSALLPKLLERGYKVRLLDLFLYGMEPIAQYQSHPKLEIIKADFRQIDVVVAAMKDMDAVIHLGAIVGDPACALDEELTIEVNLLATRMIAEVAKGKGISRFIFASTCSVYGASDLLLDERSSLNPVSLYARSKIASERVLLDLRDARFLPVMLRFGTIYGLSGRTRFDLVVNLLTAKAMVDSVITVFGSDQWRPFLHVNDAALAVFKALQASDTALTDIIFNVGSDAQNYTLGEVGRIIKRIVPSADLQFYEDNVDRRNYRVDFTRISRTLGFSPEWTLEEGIQQVIVAIRSGKVTDYKDARYSNVKFLSEEIGTGTLRIGREWVGTALVPPTQSSRLEKKPANGIWPELKGKDMLRGGQGA